MTAAKPDSASSTATVETLTAEVRVLMVGNRQITLSVAKQLDTCAVEDLEPFGRVRLGNGMVNIIGRHKETGVLVRAKCQDWLSAGGYWGPVYPAAAALPLIVLAGLR